MKIQFIQNIIDKLRKKVTRNLYINLLAKELFTFEKVKDSIDTIALGASHAQLGYRADANEFNFGLSFQDLYYSYELYKKINNPKLKNIILFYSVFSPGFQTIKTNYADACAVHKVVAGINYQDNSAAKEKNLVSLEFNYKYQFLQFKMKFRFDSNFRGNETVYKIPEQFTPPAAQERAKGHYKNNIRHNNQTMYVKKMQELANNNNQNFIVVLSPATKAYKDCLPKSSELFKDLFELSKTNNINILNMYDADIFDESDFRDWDHLSLKGAEKISAKIKDYIAQIQSAKNN